MTKIILRRKVPATEPGPGTPEAGAEGGEDMALAELRGIRTECAAIHRLLLTWSVVALVLALIGILIGIVSAT